MGNTCQYVSIYIILVSTLSNKELFLAGYLRLAKVWRQTRLKNCGFTCPNIEDHMGFYRIGAPNAYGFCCTKKGAFVQPENLTLECRCQGFLPQPYKIFFLGIYQRPWTKIARTSEQFGAKMTNFGPPPDTPSCEKKGSPRRSEKSWKLKTFDFVVISISWSWWDPHSYNWI